MKRKTNLGIMGPAGSGKGFAARHIAKKYGYKIINMGNIVRALARKEHIKPSRENLERLQARFSKKYGKDFVIEHAIVLAQASRKPVIIDGIRKPIQAELAKEKLGAKLILVDAKSEIRFERMKERRRKSGFSKTLEEFNKMEENEDKVFNLKKTFSMADFKVDNSNGERYLFYQLDRLMAQIR
jgi:dephospho-CoA kinase